MVATLDSPHVEGTGYDCVLTNTEPGCVGVYPKVQEWSIWASLRPWIDHTRIWVGYASGGPQNTRCPVNFEF